jgi:hypothetical protein
MHNEIAEYLSKYVSRIDELYRWPFKEEIPRRDFGFSFSGKTAFQKTLELNQTQQRMLLLKRKRKGWPHISLRTGVELPRFRTLENRIAV